MREIIRLVETNNGFMSVEDAQKYYDDRFVPDGWYVHGRSAWGMGPKGDELNTGNVIQMTRNLDVADQYAHGKGMVFFIRPQEGVDGIFDLSSERSNDMAKVASAYRKDLVTGLLPTEMDPEPGESVRDAWARNRGAFTPPDIVGSAEYYDHIGPVNWLYERLGVRFVHTPDGAVAFDKDIIHAVRVPRLWPDK